MWTKLDDGLFDHSKIILAGDIIGGPHGVATALGTFTAGILYANKHTTDGFLPGHVVAHWPHSRKPAQLTAALVAAGLWDVVEGGWQIHDYHDYQLSKEEVAQRRDMRREAGRLGGQRSGVVRRNNTAVIPKQDASTLQKQNEASCLDAASTMLNPVPSRPVPSEIVCVPNGTHTLSASVRSTGKLIERKQPRIQNQGDPVPLWDWQAGKFRDALRPQFGDEAYAEVLRWVHRVGDEVLAAGARVDVSDPVKWWDARYAKDWAPDPDADFKAACRALIGKGGAA